MDEVLFFLLKEGLFRTPVKIGTIRVGSALGMSQQNASRRISLLIKNGLVARSTNGISLTQKGREEILHEFKQVENAITGKKSSLILTGQIVDGFGEGKYYIGKYASQLKQILGYVPFTGTLNVKLDPTSIGLRPELQNYEPLRVAGFEDGGRRYGALLLYNCKINEQDAMIVVPERTHHGSEIVELIAKTKLRGSRTNVKIVVG